jgi:hypothetical protein
VTLVSSGYDLGQQVAQIDNFIAAKVDMIILPTVTPIAFSSLADAKGEAASSAPAHSAVTIGFKLNNGMTLMGVSYFWQLVIKGAVIIIAVLIDKYRTQERVGKVAHRHANRFQLFGRRKRGGGQQRASTQRV